MKNIIRQEPLLKVLKSTTPKLRKLILENADSKLITSIVEIIVNLLKGHIPVTPKQKRDLKRYKKSFYKLYTECCSHGKNSTGKLKNIKKASKIIVQSGGALPLLITAILPLIAKSILGGTVAAGAGIVTKNLTKQ